jgi:hypothetical protein
LVGFSVTVGAAELAAIAGIQPFSSGCISAINKHFDKPFFCSFQLEPYLYCNFFLEISAL